MRLCSRKFVTIKDGGGALLKKSRAGEASLVSYFIVVSSICDCITGSLC